ncbi:MAG: M23 family metallopeptidase [bacterium]
MNRTRLLAGVVPAAVLASLFGACAPEIVEEPFEPSASHEDYTEALSRLDLDETAMGIGWLAAAADALAAPAVVDTPFSEVALIDPREPQALGYEFVVGRGRAVTITVVAEVDRYFADLYRIDAEERAASGSRSGLTLVASRPDDADQIRFEPRRDGRYVVRIQPELLRGGRFEVTIAATASLSFPVEGGDPGDILSFYGDGRDGGIRRHEGVDIFAPRGTRLLAASDSLVARVGERDRGGNIVTLYDEERDLMLYYAHLEEQLVEQGTRVRRGDVIGTMGNSGNAITTPPHLHIGLYQGGWRYDVDPWDYFVDPPRIEPEPVRHAELVGAWARLAVEAMTSRRFQAPQPAPRWVNRNPLLRLEGAGETMGEDAATDDPADRAALSDAAEPAEFQEVPAAASEKTLPEETPVRVIAASGGLVRVALPAGGHAYLDPRSMTRDLPIVNVDTARQLRDPATGDTFATVAAGVQVAFLGRTGARTYVELDDGRVGYFEGG